jgi:hypothetical protein
VHCEVAYTQNRFLLRDNNSTNGTIHNGTKIDKTWLEFGDKIQVADTELIFSCEGYDLKDDNPEKAIEAFESSLKREPDFLDALKILAFLLERNVARRKEAAALWDKISQLEKSSAL